MLPADLREVSSHVFFESMKSSLRENEEGNHSRFSELTSIIESMHASVFFLAYALWDASDTADKRMLWPSLKLGLNQDLVAAAILISLDHSVIAAYQLSAAGLANPARHQVRLALEYGALAICFLCDQQFAEDYAAVRIETDEDSKAAFYKHFTPKRIARVLDRVLATANMPPDLANDMKDAREATYTFLSRSSHIDPVAVAAGAFAEVDPDRDMFSPGHEGQIAPAFFGNSITASRTALEKLCTHLCIDVAVLMAVLRPLASDNKEVEVALSRCNEGWSKFLGWKIRTSESA